MLLSNWVAMIFVWFMCPETTGKSLEEIDLLFAKAHVRESILANETTDSDGKEDKESGSVKTEQLV